MNTAALLLLAAISGVFFRDLCTLGMTQYRKTVSPGCFDDRKDSSDALVFNIGDLHVDEPLPGLAHISVATVKRHGMRHSEVWMQTLAKGKATPIHRHDCEEVNIVLSGEGAVHTRLASGDVVTRPFGVNATSIAAAGVVYQVANVGDGDLQVLVVMGCSSPSITIYPDWTTPDARAKKVSPMFWDSSCPLTPPPWQESTKQVKW